MKRGFLIEESKFFMYCLILVTLPILKSEEVLIINAKVKPFKRKRDSKFL